MRKMRKNNNKGNEDKEINNDSNQYCWKGY